jgi:EamA domain-containing membrane protein RarD
MRSVPMQAVGVMQYMAPTMKLLLLVAYYKTYPSTYQAAGLVFIWMGIVVFFAGESALVRHLKSFIIKHYNAAPRVIPFQRLQR